MIALREKLPRGTEYHTEAQRTTVAPRHTAAPRCTERNTLICRMWSSPTPQCSESVRRSAFSPPPESPSRSCSLVVTVRSGGAGGTTRTHLDGLLVRKIGNCGALVLIEGRTARPGKTGEQGLLGFGRLAFRIRLARGQDRTRPHDRTMQGSSWLGR
jgi:hypothetical protein